MLAALGMLFPSPKMNIPLSTGRALLCSDLGSAVVWVDAEGAFWIDSA
jgi:hypothetical protein